MYRSLTSVELAQVEGVVLTASEQGAVLAFWDGVISDVMSEVETATADGPSPSLWLVSTEERRAVRRAARRGRVAAVRSLRFVVDRVSGSGFAA